MTSANTLPTFGPAPPNIRRVPISRELQLQDPRPTASPVPREARAPEPVREPFPLPDNLAGAAVVAVQVSESANSENTDVPQAVRTQAPSVNQQLNAVDEGDNRLSGQLSEEEQAYVRELQAIDREVRAHEAAHANAGGGFAGRPTYDFITGPDGRQYAVAGSVQIDVSPVEGSPEETIRKLEIVRSAALAPARPSGQDRAVAAQAAATIRQAQADLAEERAEEAEELINGDNNNSDPLDVPLDEGNTTTLNVQSQLADRAFTQAGLLSGEVDNGLVDSSQSRFDFLA